MFSSYKVKRMLLVIFFMVAGLAMYAGECDESGSGVNSAKPTTGEYRGQGGDILGIADKVNCPQGGCPKIQP